MNKKEHYLNNFDLIICIWKNISKKRKIQVFLLFIVMLSSGFAESFSIGLVIPFIGALTDPEKVWNNTNFSIFAKILGLNGPNEILLPIVLIFGFAALLSGFIRIINLNFNLKLAAALTSDLSVKAYKKTLYQEYKIQIQKNSSETISTIITESTQTSRVLNYIMLFITSSIIFLCVLLTLFIINYKVASIAILVFGSSYLLIAKLSKNKLVKNSKLVTKANQSQMKVLQEGIGAIKDVLLKSNQEIFINIFKKEERLLRNRQAENAFIAYFPRYMMESLGLLLIAIISYLLINEKDNINEVLPLLGVLAIGAQRLIPSLQQIYTNWAGIKDRSASVQSVLRIAEMEMPIQLKPTNRVVPISENLIKIKSLSFDYQKNINTLENINLEIQKGQNIGIIGTTGSGKTTLMEILMGLIPPKEGYIQINDEDIYSERNKQLLVNWRSSISYVPQNIFLSDFSIKENVAFGLNKKDININKVKLACKAAQIEKYIESTPYKYDGLVGERGISLSGGQCQRIAIARALYENKDFLFLDEATSSIDTITEQKIMDSIVKLYSQKTIIMIAHRISTLKYCNKVIELKEGKILKIHGKEWINNKCNDQ